MPLDATTPPQVDPTPIFEHFRGSYGSELLAAAVAHLGVFDHVAAAPLSFDELRNRVGLAERPAVVLFTALRAMGLLTTDNSGKLTPTPLAAEHLLGDAYFAVADYVGLAAEAPGVKEMVARLTSNKPAGADTEEGAAFIYKDGMDSAMEAEASARHLTLALAGRAKNVAPVLAANVPMHGVELLVDVGGGTGIYSIALLQKNPSLRAIVLDRPEVLKVAAEFAAQYGVTDRLELRPGDMFTADVPACDAVLLSNILHDWDVAENRTLVTRCAGKLRPNGRLLIHDVLLHDDHSGPLPIALYSAALFTLTEGRAYSAAEYRGWLSEAGLTPEDTIATLVHCAVVPGRKPG
ncbi:MAG: methyltransferase domain-containing protein [Phycisphaera sp.]|nr:methyltransferase domain-containing protein [Phycisphaera sp.]